MTTPEITPIEVERLLCAISPSGIERVLTAMASWCWRRSETGPMGWLGDKADNLRIHSNDRRARRRLDRVVCGFRPFPGNGAYGHWTCQRQRFHFGRHRFNNYTIARIPRVWHVRNLFRAARSEARLLRLGPRRTFGYRRELYPTKYDPREVPGV